ncbi:hypothetical protein BDZ97DRAFT_891415 [Flammula alnicola]|nr:hypothetical protein BDZ97DRAFT_891415 [Flammula alnicola]
MLSCYRKFTNRLLERSTTGNRFWLPVEPFLVSPSQTQHFLVTWTQRTAEFASHVFLIDLFPTTPLPSALCGFSSTLAGVLFVGNAGPLVDNPSRLKVIRVNVLVAKLSVASLYAFLLLLLIKYPHESKLAGQDISQGRHALVWIFFTMIVLAGCVMKLSDIAMSVAIERDWVTAIASNSDARLTRLNLWMRRIDLGCKLLAPLFKYRSTDEHRRKCYNSHRHRGYCTRWIRVGLALD